MIGYIRYDQDGFLASVGHTDLDAFAHMLATGDRVVALPDDAVGRGSDYFVDTDTLTAEPREPSTAKITGTTITGIAPPALLIARGEITRVEGTIAEVIIDRPGTHVVRLIERTRHPVLFEVTVPPTST
jgi:hypothetical protein